MTISPQRRLHRPKKNIRMPSRVLHDYSRYIILNLARQDEPPRHFIHLQFIFVSLVRSVSLLIKTTISAKWLRQHSLKIQTVLL